LEGLDTIDWASLTHAHGEATDLPELLRSLLSEDPEVRMEAIAHLLETIWHQGTVFPASAAAVPFLYELLSHPDVQDKGGIVCLLGAIADGRGYLEVHARDDYGERAWRRILGKQGRSLEEALAQEAAEIDSVRRAVSAGLRHLLPYLSDAESELRWDVATALGNYPEHASWSVPAIDAALASNLDEHVRQALATSKARLTNG